MMMFRSTSKLQHPVNRLIVVVIGLQVVDSKSREVVHTFQVPSQNTDPRLASALLTNMCCSPDGQWVAAATNSGHIVVFNMETLRYESYDIYSGILRFPCITLGSLSYVLVYRVL